MGEEALVREISGKVTLDFGVWGMQANSNSLGESR